jgi:hypothetical protein
MPKSFEVPLAIEEYPEKSPYIWSPKPNTPTIKDLYPYKLTPPNIRFTAGDNVSAITIFLNSPDAINMKAI